MGHYFLDTQYILYIYYLPLFSALSIRSRAIDLNSLGPEVFDQSDPDPTYNIKAKRVWY